MIEPGRKIHRRQISLNIFKFSIFPDLVLKSRNKHHDMFSTFLLFSAQLTSVREDHGDYFQTHRNDD